MEFDFVSDMHVDRWPHDRQINWQREATNRVLVVAGDIASDPDHSIHELKRAAKHYEWVLYVPGNHEYESRGLPFSKTSDYYRNELSDTPNVICLEDGVFVKDGVAFIGRTGWWDFTFAEPWISPEDTKSFYLGSPAEKKRICDAIAAQAQRDYEWLQNTISALQDDPSVESIVVTTHTVPHRDLMPWSNENPPKAFFAGCDGNPKMEKILQQDKNKKIKAWLFGHYHWPLDRQIDHVDYLNHPRGRPGDKSQYSAHYGPAHVRITKNGAQMRRSFRHAPKAKPTQNPKLRRRVPLRRAPG